MFYGGFVAEQSVTEIIPLAATNLVTPKGAAKQELLFSKQASILLSGVLTVLSRLLDLGTFSCQN